MDRHAAEVNDPTRRRPSGGIAKLLSGPHHHAVAAGDAADDTMHVSERGAKSVRFRCMWRGERHTGRRHSVLRRLHAQAGTTSTEDDGPPIARISGTEASTTKPVSSSNASGRR